LAAAARRAIAKNKKQENLITATETKAQKAVAKADELRKKLDNAKKAIKEKLPALQSNKKIKGVAGKSTPTPTTATASFVGSPQRKAFSAKKRVNTVGKRPFSLAALPISLYRDIPKPNVDLHGRVDTAGLPRAD
jgi:hypothetical protein